MNKVKLVNETLICKCGKRVDVSHITDEASEGLTIFNSVSSSAQKVNCECGNEYLVTLSVSMKISIDDYEIEEIFIAKHFDKEGNPILPSLFENATLGTAFSHIKDGEYIFGDTVYVVEDGVFESRYSNAVDPNQIALEI